ncbi:DUF2335 domain-containing protein [Anaerococcus porci]|uniref:DUF2335 domain-containing protein n=1 Tax=Anaerococcus porci TaxID=2652269 RepID=UPI002A7651CD|nr:DUF2335 domain-containing protein [Anaerococcus porci]MDY3006275.1 DUF2335 domain-containing protein [Anaerococcus porci]
MTEKEIINNEDIEKSINGLESLTDDEINIISSSFMKNPKEVMELIEENSTLSVQHMEQMEQMFAGPLPHPDILKGYGNIDSSFPDRILKLAEKDQEHSISMEQYAIEENFKANKRGTYAGLIVCVLAIFIGAFLIYNDKSVAGLVTLLTPLAGLIVVFIKSNKKDNSNYNKIN